MTENNSILGLIKSILCKLNFIEENCTVCMGQATYPEKCNKIYTTNLYTILDELEDKVDFIVENCFGCNE